VEGSTLELYTKALRLRRELDALGDGSMAWLDAPGGVLYFEREPGVRVAVNLTGEAVELAADGEVLVASGPVGEPAGGTLALPAETAVWLRG
jgi:alpha-glucosidase